jgi:hypothetical protein
MMAAATSVTSFITVHGPIKIEWVTCTMASDGDDYASKLVTPKFAVANLNDTGTANCVTSISGKTVTVVNADISASLVHLIIVGH